MADPLVNFFDTLEPKAAPLYSCNSWIDGIRYRIPKKLDCTLVNTEKPSSVVNVTLWFKDITVLKVTAYECYAITTTNVMLLINVQLVPTNVQMYNCTCTNVNL